MKEAIEKFNQKLAEYIEAGKELSTAYMNEVQRLMGQGKHDEALELLKDCPCRVTQVGLSNLVEHEKKKS
jgi:hypothetical protein